MTNLSLRAKSNKTDANIAHYFIDYRPKVIFSLKRMLLTFGYSLNNFVDNFTVNFVDSFKVNFKERFGEQFVDNFLINFVDNTRDNFRDNLEDNLGDNFCAQLFPVVRQSSGNCKTQKYSRLRCLLRFKGLVIGFYLGWSGHTLLIRKI